MPIRQMMRNHDLQIHFQARRNPISFNKNSGVQEIMTKRSHFAATKRMAIDYDEFCIFSDNPDSIPATRDGEKIKGALKLSKQTQFQHAQNRFNVIISNILSARHPVFDNSDFSAQIDVYPRALAVEIPLFYEWCGCFIGSCVQSESRKRRVCSSGYY
jgi:hypothetical protein